MLDCKEIIFVNRLVNSLIMLQFLSKYLAHIIEIASLTFYLHKAILKKILYIKGFAL